MILYIYKVWWWGEQYRGGGEKKRYYGNIGDKVKSCVKLLKIVEHLLAFKKSIKIIKF